MFVVLWWCVDLAVCVGCGFRSRARGVGVGFSKLWVVVKISSSPEAAKKISYFY